MNELTGVQHYLALLYEDNYFLARYIERATDMRGKTLSYKQEAFFTAWMKNGGNAIEAARTAGYKHPESATPSIMKAPSMRRRIQEHQAKVEEKAVWGKANAMAILRQQAEDTDLCARDRQRAIEQLARLNGWYAPAKSEAHNKTEIEVSIADSRFLRSLDAEEERRKLENRQAVIDAEFTDDDDDGIRIRPRLPEIDDDKASERPETPLNGELT